MNWELGVVLRPDAAGSDRADRKLQIEWPYQPQTLRPYRSGEVPALRGQLRDIRSTYWKHIAEVRRQAVANAAFAAAQKKNASAPQEMYRGVETADGPASKAQRKRGSIEGYVNNNPQAAAERVTGAQSDETEMAMVKAWVRNPHPILTQSSPNPHLLLT